MLNLKSLHFSLYFIVSSMLCSFACTEASAAIPGIVLKTLANPSKVQTGERIRFAATVSNSGTATETIVLSVTVPAKTTVARVELSTSAFCNGTPSWDTCTGGQTLQFGNFNLPGGATATVQYPALVSAATPPAEGAVLSSKATVSLVGGTTSVTTSASALYSASADRQMQITSSAFPTQVIGGGTLSYTLHYANPGTASVPANINFAVPAGTTFVSASDGGVNNAGTVTWTLGTVPAGAAGQRTVVLKVGAKGKAGTQIITDALLSNATTQALLADAKLSSPVGSVSTGTVVLTSSVAATPSTVTAGQRVRYAITVSNTGTSTRTVVVSATMPADTSLTNGESSSGGFCDGNPSYATCTAGQTFQFGSQNVPAHASATFVYYALVSSATPPLDGQLLNTDILIEDLVGSESSANIAAVATSSAASQMQITSSALPAQAVAGASVAYTLYYGNPGAAPVAANLTMLLPLGATFVSASDGGTSANGVVTWPLGTVAAGATGRRTLVLKSSANAAPGSQWVTDAALRDPTTEALLADAALSTSFGDPTVSNLSVSATADRYLAAAGDRVFYSVTVTNNSSARTLLFQATVPANTTVIRAELSSGANCAGAGSLTTCTAGQTLSFGGINVSAGASVTLVIPATISTTTPPVNGQLLSSTVWVQDITSGNDYHAVATAAASSASASQLQVISSALPAQAPPGAKLAYTISYSNPGSAAAPANLIFAVPAGTTFVSASDGGTNASGVITWPLGTLAAGGSGKRSLVLKVAATAAPGGMVFTDAVLRNPTNQNLLADAALATCIGSPAELQLNVSATVTPLFASAGQPVRYAITVSDTGTGGHTLGVRATVPENTTVLGAENSPSAYCDGSPSTSCNAGQTLAFSGTNVPAGGSVTFVFFAIVSATSPPPNGKLLVSEIWVQDLTLNNTYPLNAAAVASNSAARQLQVAMSASPSQVLPGGTITYSLTYGNAGASPAAATLTFPVPSGSSFVSASNGGANSGGTVSWPLGTLAAGAFGTRTVVVKAAAATAAPAGSQVVGEADLRDPTSAALLAAAELSTGVSNAAEKSLDVSVTVSPANAAVGQKVTYSILVTNSATSGRTLIVQATVPPNTGVTGSQLSSPASCDGSVAYTVCAAGQTLDFSGFNIPASGSVTVTYPAVVSAATSNGTLLHSEVLVLDSTNSNQYQANATAVASGTPQTPANVVTGQAQQATGGASVERAERVNAPNGHAQEPDLAVKAAAAGTDASVRTARAESGAPITTVRAVVVLNRTEPRSSLLNAAEPDAQWPSYLSQRLTNERPTADGLLVEQGGRAMSLFEQPPSLAAAAQAKYVIFLDDMSDVERTSIRSSTGISLAASIIERHRAMIDRAHGRGLKIYGGTLPPFEGTTFPAAIAVGESTRATVNEWIRTRAKYDGIADFDLALSDPKHPTRLLPAYDSGDHLHPSDAGSEAMANAVDLSWFEH